MEVPLDILENLKCHKCSNYLCNSPAYLQNNGYTRCRECFDSKQPANRMIPYETAAKFLKFPCKNGCNEWVLFDEEETHKNVCEMADCNCPIEELNCTWTGQRNRIMSHIQATHPDHLLKNPCSLRYDMAISMKTYAIFCFDVLFILYTKVCLASGKIYHAIKLFDNPNKADDYKYILDIKRDELMISRPGKVMPQNCTDENYSIVTSISSLMEILNGFSGSVFTIKLQKLDKEVKKLEEKPVPVKEKAKKAKEKPAVVKQKPANVPFPIKLPEVPESSTTEERYCRYKKIGCTYKATNIKCEKHEYLFCSFRNFCWLCWVPVTKDSWKTHNNTVHKIYTHKVGTFFKLTPYKECGRIVFIKPESEGYIACRYFLNKSHFEMFIWTNYSSKILEKSLCTINIKTSGQLYSFTQAGSVVQKDKLWDWYMKVEKEKNNFINWDVNNFEISVLVAKEK